ncbi:hypothetical protein HDV00_003871 [Rhizophlyctis rosea]|nr:hypothetical protein HDV00_003871 [Rhizophlyctis rosea]
MEAPEVIKAVEPTLEGISTETKQRLLLFVRPEEVLPLSEVCRSWRDAASDDSWWKRLYRSKFPTNEQGNNKRQKYAEGYISKDAHDGSWKRQYLMDVGHLCIGCHDITKDKCSLSGDRVCRSCQKNLPSYKRMAVSHAKSAFCLTEKDVRSLPSLIVDNPHYRSSAPMRLYLVKHLRAASYAKHGGAEGLEKKKEKNRVAAEKRRNTKKDNKVNRREDLEAALAAKGLELRSDSQRCANYIEGKGRLSLEQVVEIMYRMHIIHEHSVYTELLDNEYDNGHDEFYESDYDDRTFERRRYFNAGAFREWWEETKDEQEGKAVDLFNKALTKYRALPKKEQTAKKCECGMPHIKDLVREQM